MQDNYDPHKDLDFLREFSSSISRSAVDRVRNWIDEAAWNTDQKFSDEAKEKMVIHGNPSHQDTAPLGARGEAVNKVRTLDREVTPLERQMNDVRNKNTALEALIITLRKQSDNHRQFGESAYAGRQAAIDEAYQRGLREGKTEARTEYLHGFTDGTAYNPNDKAFTSD